MLIISQQTDSLQIDYNYINSVPQNADVYINGILTGQTPLHFKWDTLSSKRKISLRLKGYTDFSFEPKEGENTINKTISLIPINKNLLNETVYKNGSSSFVKPVKIFPLVITSVVTAGSAVLAYYFKSLAIDKGEEFEFTGDPALLDKKKKYDLIGGISLAVFQLGLGAFIYFHFIDN